MLYTDEGVGIENITNNAFLSSNKANKEEFAKLYVYTTLMYDIILNPGYPLLDISRKALELCFKRFKVFVKFVKFIFVI